MQPGPASAEVDAVDQQIIAALQINGRASWKDVATATGISESTVVRRGKRLLAGDILHIVAYVDVVRAGLGNPVLIRVTSAPSKYEEVLDALRRRPDVRFCVSATGPAAFIVEIVAPDRAALVHLLSQELAQISGVTKLETLSITRTFHSTRAWNEGLLTPRAIQILRGQGQSEAGAGATAPQQAASLDAIDRELLLLLAANGRLSNKELADKLQTSASTIGRRLVRLEQSGVVHFRAVLAPEAAGFGSQLLIWMQVDSSRLDEVARILIDNPATKFLWAIAGRFNMCLGIQLHDIRDMYYFETEVLSKLPGIQQTEVSEHLQDIRRNWIRLTGTGGPSSSSTASAALSQLFDARATRHTAPLDTTSRF